MKKPYSIIPPFVLIRRALDASEDDFTVTLRLIDGTVYEDCAVYGCDAEWIQLQPQDEHSHDVFVRISTVIAVSLI